MTADKGAERILVVEDEQIARENLVLVLEREGYEVVGVDNGTKALRVLEAEDFDLVLTDLSMPDVGGMEVLEHCRRVRPDTEVLVITGYATVDSAVEAMRQGAYHYLPKPYKIEELSRVIHEIEDRVAEPTYQADWYFLFEGGCIVWDFDAEGEMVATVDDAARRVLGFYDLAGLRRVMAEQGYYTGP